MNRIRIVALAAALLLAPAALAADPPAKPNEQLIKQLGGEGAPPAKTAAEFEAAYAKVLPELIAKPEADDAPLQRIAFRASRPGAETERAALCKALTSRLAGDSSTAQKVLLLRHIERIGREEVVPAVAAVMNGPDEKLREPARRGLAHNPTKAAADALRDAIARADEGKWKGALIGALAHRRDAADAPVFAKAAAGTEESVRIPAMLALARTGDASAAPILAAARDTGTDAGKAAAHDAYLLLAERLMALDQRPAAAKIYREYLYSPHRYRYAAIVGLARAGTDEDVVKILNILAEKDAQARGAALAALADRPAPSIANEIIARLAKADATARPWLLRALIDQRDKRTRQILTDAAADPDEAVRIQAITALARFGDSSAVPQLLKSAASKGEEQVAARNTLEMIPGTAVDDALLERLPQGSPAERGEVMRALGARRTAAAVDPLFATATDADAGVRADAYKALAQIAEPEVVPRLLDLLADAREDGDRDNASKATVAVARKDDNVDARTAPILERLPKSESKVSAALLNILGQLGGEKALAAIREAIKSDDEKTHEAGVRALVNWPDPTPLNDLLALAKEDKNNTLAILSLRGYVRLAGLPSKRPPVETLKLLQEALAVAKRPDEKKMILGGLGDVKDVKALETVAPFLADESLASEAVVASVKIARDQWEKNMALTKTTLSKVLDVSKSETQKKAAKETLDKIAAREKEKAEQEKRDKEKKDKEKKPA
jgi:HEAT repeat protein